MSKLSSRGLCKPLLDNFDLCKPLRNFDILQAVSVLRYKRHNVTGPRRGEHPNGTVQIPLQAIDRCMLHTVYRYMQSTVGGGNEHFMAYSLIARFLIPSHGTPCYSTRRQRF